MSNTTRYDFTHPQCAGWDCCGGGRIDEDDTGAYVAFEDYKALQERLTATEAERDKLREQLTAATEQRDAAYALAAVPYEHRTIHAERTLAALREPSEAVARCAIQRFTGFDSEPPPEYIMSSRNAIRAAVATAEKEISND